MILDAALLVLAVSALLAVVRLIAGPSLADRVASLDMLVVVMVVTAGVWSVKTDRGWYLDAALVMALVSFFATIAFARHIEKGDRVDKESQP